MTEILVLQAVFDLLVAIGAICAVVWTASHIHRAVVALETIAKKKDPSE